MHQLPIGTPVDLETSINFYIPEHREVVRMLLQRAIQTGKEHEGEFIKVTAKGKLFWVHLKMKPILVKGKTAKLVGIVQDITKRKSADITREKGIRENLQLITENVIQESELDRFVINYRLNERVAQLLSAAKMMNGMIGHGGHMNEKRLKETATILTTASKELDQLNDILNVPRIKIIGIEGALADMIARLSTPLVMKIDFNNSSKHMDSMDYDTQLMIYRIVEDHLKFILKNSNPEKLSVTLADINGQLNLKMEDNSSFDNATAESEQAFIKMKGRIERHHGTVTVTSGLPKGCFVNASVPLSQIAAAKKKSKP
jgi:signal transduction histidine kinase